MPHVQLDDAVNKPLPLPAELPRLMPVWRDNEIYSPLGNFVSSHGLVFDQDHGRVRALSAETGEERWQFDTGAGSTSTPATVDDLVFVVTRRQTWQDRRPGVIFALDAATGVLRWKHSAPCRAMVGFKSGLDIAIARASCQPKDDPKADLEDVFIRIDLKDGRELWRVPLRSSAQVVHDERALYTVLIRGWTFDVIALDLETGQVLWRQSVGRRATIGLFGNVLVADGSGGLIGLDTETGAEKWAYEIADERRVFPESYSEDGVQMLEGLALAMTRDAVVGLDPRTGTEKKRWPMPWLPPFNGGEPERAVEGSISASEEGLLGFVRYMTREHNTKPKSRFLIRWVDGGFKAYDAPPSVTSVKLRDGNIVLFVPEDNNDEGVLAFDLDRLQPARVELGAEERVAAVLSNIEVRFFESEKDFSPDALFAIEGGVKIVQQIAADEFSDLRKEAVVALGYLRDSDSVPVLMAILDESMPSRPRGEENPYYDAVEKEWAAVARGERTDLLDAANKWRPSADAIAAGERRFDAMELKRMALWAALRHEHVDVSEKLAAITLNRDPILNESWIHDLWAEEAYSYMARHGGQGSAEALAAMDKVSFKPEQGFAGGCKDPSDLMSGTDVFVDTIWRPTFKVENLEFVSLQDGLWVCDSLETGKRTPRLVLAGVTDVRIDSISTAGDEVFVVGEVRGDPNSSEIFPWQETVRWADVARDQDGDGLSDRTEIFLGSDPTLTDSDGDGKPDGEDGAPAVASGQNAESLMAEVVRFFSMGRLGELADESVFHVYAGPTLHTELPGFGRVIAYHDRMIPDDEGLVPRFPEPLFPGMMVDSVSMKSQTATVVVHWAWKTYPFMRGLNLPGVEPIPSDKTFVFTAAYTLDLKRTGDRWRVTRAIRD